MSQFRRFVEEGRLTRIGIDRKLVRKEVEGAASDLEEARDSLKRKKFKWATVQGYYSMFHSARALLYCKGFREKSHYALLVALRELFKNELTSEILQDFDEAMNLREEADYGLVFSEEASTRIVTNATKFLERTKEILCL